MRTRLLLLASAITLVTALRGAPTAGFTLSEKFPVSEEFWAFAPPSVGEFTPGNAFSFDPNVYDSKTKAAKEAARFVYQHSITNTPTNPLSRRSITVDVIKYPSEAAAQAEVKKRTRGDGPDRGVRQEGEVAEV